MEHPFAELIGLNVDVREQGYSECSIAITDKLLNPHSAVHGAVLYALADTGMGAALYPSLKDKELCATIEIKINYYQAVRSGRIRCATTVINQGKKVANMESKIYVDDSLVAQANGNYAIFIPSKTPQSNVT